MQPMQHHHPAPLLRLANACHPDMDGEQRRRIMLDVAVDRGMEEWIRRL